LWLSAIEGSKVIDESVFVTELSGEQYRPAGSADGVGNKGAVEYNPFFGEFVNMRSHTIF